MSPPGRRQADWGRGRAAPRGAPAPRAEDGEAAPAKPRGTAWDRALRLLAVRDRSRAELEQRLTAARFPPEDVEATLVRLESAGLIDDERFARLVVEHGFGIRLEGRRSVEGTLRQRGVPPGIIQEAIAEAEGDELRRACELAERRAARAGWARRDEDPRRTAQRLFEFLVRRGYDLAVAREAVARTTEIHAEDGVV